jgi:hypothetical protein
VRLLAKAAGVKLTYHTLRKGFGCRHAARVPAQVLQRLMRHSSIATTMTYYANIDLAVEEAILGPATSQLRGVVRNTRSNTSSEIGLCDPERTDANHSEQTICD